MAVFDLREQRMCVRVVYDGVAGAGKTSNLRQLCSSFASQRATELISPAELDGRTLFFDWVQFAAGVVCGYPLICQVISVPGQVVLGPRRRHLLASADVVVYVSDSSASSANRAREGLDLLMDVVRGRSDPPPIILQANKQDQPDALDAAALAETLGLNGSVVLEAIAIEGIGVVDTFVSAVRTVARDIQGRAERGGLRVPVRSVERPDEVLRRLEREAVDPEWAAELLLEEASNAFLLAEAAASGSEPRRRKEAAEPAQAPARLPHADVPTGFVWPAHTGRTTLRALAQGGALDKTVDADEGGHVVHRIGDHVLATSSTARFGDLEAARQALVRAARERTQLEALLVPETVIVVRQADDGAPWMWTIHPALPTVIEALEDAPAERQREIATAFGTAVVDAVRAGLRHGLRVETSPTAYGLQAGAVRYVGGVAPATDAPSLDAIVEAAETLGSLQELVIEAAEAALPRRLSSEELRRLGATATSDDDGGSRSAARARLREAIARLSEAA